MKLFFTLLLTFLTFQVTSQELLTKGTFNGVDFIITKKVNDTITYFDFILESNQKEYDYTVFREKDRIRYRTAGNAPIKQTFRISDNGEGISEIYLKVVVDGEIKTYDIDNKKEVN